MSDKKQVKPPWLRINPLLGDNFINTKNILKSRSLVTVCVEANCPNISKCWHESGTATFMILGDTCTRSCRFCSVKTAPIGSIVDKAEPLLIAQAVKELNLSHVVLTSVDRDDLDDQGAGHFVSCILKIKEINPDVSVEVLIPDFSGREDLLKLVVDANPDVIGHNVEVVESLQKKVRDARASYDISLRVLKKIKELNKNIFTKSSLMLGLGERDDEVLNSFKDLRDVDCDFLTIGQYLKPTKSSIDVHDFVHPEKFVFFKKKAEEFGFKKVFSGPFVRSSFKAGDFFKSASNSL